MIVTMFKNMSFTESQKPIYVTASSVFERIRTGKVKDKIELIRNTADEEEQTKLKRELPCICFSGKFLRRNDSSLSTHSGLCILDFDGVADIPTLKKEISALPFIVSVFLSPRANGLKAVARIPAEKKSHRGYYQGLLKVFPNADVTSINESRICFDSYDPDIYVNLDATEFAQYITPDVKPPINSLVAATRTAVRTDYAKLDICLNMISKAVKGTRHDSVLKASKLAGGFIASGQVREEDAIRLLQDVIERVFEGEDIRIELKAMHDGLEYGKVTPIYELEQQEIGKKDVINNGVTLLSDCWGDMVNQYNTGKKRGSSTHFPKLDQHFTFKDGDLTAISGLPNSGKTAFILQLMLIKSFKDRWKWAIFTPENYPADEFYDTLIEMLVGKSCDPYYPYNLMSMQEYEEAAKFIGEYFFFVYPETAHTIKEVEGNFEYLIGQFGCKGVLLDPYNQLSHETTLREDQYISDFLTKRKRFALTHDINYFINIHPRGGLFKNRETGEYGIIDFYDLAGGAMWANKCDNFLVTHRPLQFSQPGDTTVEFHSKKIKKQKLVGTPGYSTFTFNRKSQRYYENDFSPLEEYNSVINKPVLVTYDTPPVVKKFEVSPTAISDFEDRIIDFNNGFTENPPF